MRLIPSFVKHMALKNAAFMVSVNEYEVHLRALVLLFENMVILALAQLKSHPVGMHKLITMCASLLLSILNGSLSFSTLSET